MSKAEVAAGLAYYRQWRATIAEIVETQEWDELSGEDRSAFIADAMSIVAAHDAEREPCRWTYDADSDLWTSSCGEDWTFIDGGPTDNQCKFCHGCGKPIEVTP